MDPLEINTSSSPPISISERPVFFFFELGIGLIYMEGKTDRLHFHIFVLYMKYDPELVINHECWSVPANPLMPSVLRMVIILIFYLLSPHKLLPHKNITWIFVVNVKVYIAIAFSSSSYLSIYEYYYRD